MANPLMGLLGSNPMPGNNPFQLIQQFQQFKKNFKGDPRQQVQDLLNSGKMTQEQLDQCTSMARSLQNILH
jgi:hypothetical protein